MQLSLIKVNQWELADMSKLCFRSPTTFVWCLSVLPLRSIKVIFSARVSETTNRCPIYVGRSGVETAKAPLFPCICQYLFDHLDHYTFTFDRCRHGLGVKTPVCLILKEKINCCLSSYRLFHLISPHLIVFHLLLSHLTSSHITVTS